MLPLEHSAILLTCIKRFIICLKTQFLVFFLSGHLRKVFLYLFSETSGLYFEEGPMSLHFFSGINVSEYKIKPRGYKT